MDRSRSHSRFRMHRLDHRMRLVNIEVHVEASINTIKEGIYRAGAELLRACKEGLDELAVELVSLGMSVDYQCGIGSGTPLIIAVKNGHLRIVQEMLRLGANPNLADVDGKTALMHAARRCPEAIEALALAGADLDQKDKNGQTALMHAARLASSGAIEQLIARGADLNSRSNNGVTALALAAASGNKDGALLLINAGSNLELGNKQGLTPLLLSAMNGEPEVIASLLDVGANAQSKGTLLMGADECGRNAYAHGVNALMMAASSGSNKAVELFLAAGLDPKETASTGRCAADFARAGGHLDTEAMLVAHQEAIALSNTNGIARGVDAGRKNRI